MGATEAWSPAAEISAAAEVFTGALQPAPDFDTHVWMVDVHAELNAMEDAFQWDVEYIWNRFYDWLKIDARTRMELAGVSS